MSASRARPGAREAFFVYPPRGRRGTDPAALTSPRRLIMLVLSRRPDEELVIDGNIRITVLEVRGNQVRLGISAPPAVTVLRREVLDREGGGVAVSSRLP